MSEDTEPIPGSGDRRHQRKLVRFDPTFSSGNIATIFTIVVGLFGAYGKYESDRATTKQDIDTIKANALAEKIESRAAIKEIRDDVRAVQTSITSVDKNVTGIKAEIDARARVDAARRPRPQD